MTMYYIELNAACEKLTDLTQILRYELILRIAKVILIYISRNPFVTSISQFPNIPISVIL